MGLDLVPDAIFCTDGAGLITFANAAFRRLSQGAVCLAEAVPPLAKALARVGPEPGADRCIAFRLVRDAQMRFCEATVALRLGADGNPCGLAGSIRDRTHQHAAEIAITERERAEEQLAALAENSSDAIFRLGLDGICRYASPAATELKGVPATLLEGHRLGAACHPDDAGVLRDAFADFRDGLADLRVIEWRSPAGHAPGEFFWIEANCRLVRDPAGAPSEIVASLRNVDERKRLQADLAEAMARAEEFARTQSVFLANMSHEIRTPMNGVIGLTDLLKRTSLDAEQRGYVEHLSSSGHTMMRLLNDLLELSRLRSATIQFEIDAIETAKLLEEIAEHVRFGVGVKPIAVTLDIAAGVPARFLGDEARVRQVLLNLAGNAAKFTAAGEITIHASRRMLDDRDMLAISLQDTGIGITADEFELIFEPFAQASAATHRLYGGTGLGLSIVTQLVSLMGGRILAESIPGKGSIFELVLPFSPVTAAPTAGENENEGEAMAATPPSPRRRGRVLVAEDNAVNQLVLGAMLDRLGVEAVMAGDGTEALARLEAEPSGFDLVLMDVEMPTLDGLRTTQRIRAAGLDAGLLPIIAVTANVLAETVAKCLESGMQACLAKPILIDDLDAILRTYLSAAPEHITTC